MKNLFQKLRRILEKRGVLFAGLIGVLVIGSVISEHQPVFIGPESPDGGLSLKFAGNQEKAKQIINEWSLIKSDGKSATDLMKQSIYWDFALIICYVVLLSGLAFLVGNAYRPTKEKAFFRKLAHLVGTISGVLVVLAGIIDVAENILILTMIENGASDRLAMALTFCATVKFWILRLVCLYIVLSGGWYLFSRHGELLRVFYLLRVQIFCLFLVIGLALLGSFGALTFQNIFITDDWWDPLLIGIQMGMFLSFILFSIRITVESLRERFGLREEMAERCESFVFTGPKGKFSTADYLMIGVFILFSIVVAIRWEGEAFAGAIADMPAWLKTYFPVLLALTSQIFGAAVVVLSANWIVNHASRWISRAVKGLRERFPTYNLGRFFWERFGPGYTERPKDDETGFTSLRTSHRKATGAFVALLVLYAFAYLLLSPDKSHWEIGKTRSDLVPALSYLIGLFFIALSFLSGAAFLLDYYRVPLISALVLWSVANYSLWQVDHFFEVSHTIGETNPLPSATDAFRERERKLTRKETALEKDSSDSSSKIGKQEKTPIIIVCAAGGGIQAAAWTAMVLERSSRIEEMPLFEDAVFLISSTSGGSVGAYHFLEGFDRNTGTVHAKSDSYPVFQAATTSSLEETMWGLVFPDTMKVVFPLLGRLDTRDRSWAIEHAWKRQGKKVRDGVPGQSPGSWMDWAEAAGRGTMPAVIFNSTKVENGGQLKISTVELAANAAQPSAERQEWFHHVYKHNSETWPDIDTVTAARLSASFPYITPVARARAVDGEGEVERDIELPAWHLGDGGYFDNFGVVGAVEWIRANQKAIKDSGRDVLILQLVGFPSGQNQDIYDGPHSIDSRGWRSAFLGPAYALLAVRTSTQMRRGNLEISMLEESAAKDLFKIENLEVKTEWGDDRAPPLSWELSKADKDYLHANWNGLIAAIGTSIASQETTMNSDDDFQSMDMEIRTGKQAVVESYQRESRKNYTRLFKALRR